MNRVAIIGGARTAFVKAGTSFAQKHFLDLGIAAAKGALERTKLDPTQLEELIFSTVLLDPRMPNAARELVIRSGLPKSIPAHFISNNCISGLVAINMLAEGIASARLSCGMAGGAESMSRPSLALSPSAEKFFLRLARARKLGERMQVLATFRPKYLMPLAPSPKEPSTGLTMGEHCEITAKEFAIAREAQDQYAARSHINAAQAQAKGYLEQEIIALDGVSRDNLVRGDTSVEKLAKLRPVFDRSDKGTLTAGNSSALTDGASMICLMSEERAKREGRKILGFLRAVEFAGIDPQAGLLMAPGLAVPRLLARQKLQLANIDLFEIHEAFAAQVLSNMKAWREGWARFPELKPIGEIPSDKLNPNGGSLAIGHPFAATGGRLILAVVNELQRSGKQLGLISVCAAGAMACAMLISRD